jgi:aspartyl-tRNA(Asn)/glutamyl-tRNA(Gln) amidotransferase subunit C
MAVSGAQPQRLSSDDVRHIALLCRVGLSDDEVERMRDQLSHILEQFQALQGIDTAGVEPTGHSVDVGSVMRPDVPIPPMTPGEVLSNAPRREGDLFRVQAVLEDNVTPPRSDS